MIAIIFALLDINRFGTIFTSSIESLGIWAYILNLIVTCCMIVCVIATIFSGYEYLKEGKDLLKYK